MLAIEAHTQVYTHMHKKRGEQRILAGPILIHPVSYKCTQRQCYYSYYPIGLVSIVDLLNALIEILLNRLNEFYFVQCYKEEEEEEFTLFK